MDGAPSQEGSLKRREVSKHQETLSLLSLCRVLEAQRATWQGGKINKQLKPTYYEPNSNSPSGEAAQMPAPSTSKRGLGREAQAASLRVRIWPEYPERYLSELIWASKPDCGISTTWKASPNLRHRQAHAWNKGLNRDSGLQTIRLRWQAARARRGQSQPQRDIIYKTVSRLLC